MRRRRSRVDTQEQFDCGTVAAALAAARLDVPDDLDIDAIAGPDAPRGAHVMRGPDRTDKPRGAHVNKADPLWSVERRALHAAIVKPDAQEEAVLASLELDGAVAATAVAATPVAATPVVTTTAGPPEPDAAIAAPRKARATTKRRAHASPRRRWGLVPVAGAATALAAGLGGGAAFAFFTGGPGSGHVPTGTPITITAVATTGTADLLPGRPGAVYFTLHNQNSVGTTFEQVAPGASVVSNDTTRCSSGDVSIAQSLPYTIPTGVTVSSGATSAVLSIPNLVVLAPDAPDTCQGVTFTVTLTLSGVSS